jgi:hypothetical protein
MLKDEGDLFSPEQNTKVLITELGCHHHDSGPILESSFWIFWLNLSRFLSVSGNIRYY